MSLESDVEMLLKKRPTHDPERDCWVWLYNCFERCNEEYDSGENNIIPVEIHEDLRWHQFKVLSFVPFECSYGTYCAAMKQYKHALARYAKREVKKIIKEILK